MRAHITRSESEKVRLAQSICDYLNELIELDSNALHALMETRVRCNLALAEHPTVQAIGLFTDDGPFVGLIGVINGLIGADTEGCGYLVACFDSSGKLARFELNRKFLPRESTKPQSE